MAKRRTSSSVVVRQREVVAKAYAIGRDIEPSAAKQDRDETEGIFERSQALEPPYDPEVLVNLLEVSNSLRQNVDAYAVNVDGFGNRFEPVVDLDADDADETVADAIVMERIHQQQLRGNDDPDISELEPSPKEVADRKKALTRAMRIERRQLTAFFAFAAQGMSFPALRKLTRQDIEVTGNGYWEVLRNNANRIARFVYVPSWTMRLRGLIKKEVEINERFQVSPVSFSTVKVKRKFRTYVQLTDDGPIYFKQFGDPRTVSRKTGKVYASPSVMSKSENGAKPATEIIHFEVPSPRSPYGVPRWMGALISVLGSRSSEEVNFFYFENKAVPPLAILVSGGRLSKSSVPMIEDFVENNLKGRRNFHKVMIIEAVSPAGRGPDAGPTPQRPMIEIKPLMEAQLQDAMFQKYDERNMDKVGGAFRLPRLLRGESKDFNRATADAALRMAEDQVFQPLRDDFDFSINTSILPELDAKYHSFRSNSPLTRNPETMGKLVAELVKQGVLTPGEGRELASDIFNRDFVTIKDAWAKQPMQFTLAGIQTGQAAPAAKGMLTTGDLARAGVKRPAQGEPPRIPSITDDDPKRLAQSLLRIRNLMASAEADVEKQRLASERIDGDDGETIVIEVPTEKMNEWIDADTGDE